MIKCPKCGFSQPKDQYCANCGIDMGVYSPPTRSFYSVLISTPFFSFLLLALVIGGTALFLQQHKGQELRYQIEYMKHGDAAVPRKRTGERRVRLPAVSNDTLQNDLGERDGAEKEVGLQQGDLVAQAGGGTSGTLGASGATSATSASGASASIKKSPASTTKKPKFVKLGNRKRNFMIQFAEVTNEFHRQLRQRTDSSGQYETSIDYSAGVIADQKNALFMRSSMGMRSLQKASVHIPALLEKEARNEQFFGNYVPELDLRVGFTVYIRISEYVNGIARGYIELLRNMKGTEHSNLQSVYSLNFELPPRALLFFSNLMPSDLEFENDKLRYLKHPIFQIFNSSTFRERGSSLAFILFNES